jgi:uncharacterized membrane protein YphA (DoxX/SURF4 family)
MFDSQPERIPNRTGIVALWLVRIGIGISFIAIGASKFNDPMWIRIFERIGLGQWFRYLTGILQICGGALTLIPRLSRVGLALLACTMAGAVIAWCTGLHAPQNAPIPGFLLVALIVMAVIFPSRAA